MTVFVFQIHYEIGDEFPQERYVIAETEEQAIEKLNRHFETQRKEGFAVPESISYPIVELNNVI